MGVKDIKTLPMLVYELFRTSALISGIIALSIIAAVGYLAVSGQEIPDTLSALATTIIGFYFGQKSMQRQ